MAVGGADPAETEASSSLALTGQKALEVAKALATDPKLLMLDEVRASYEVAPLIIEHDIETITRPCPRVVVLNFSKLISEGI